MKPTEKIYPLLPNLALSIQQPWAWLIVNGYKDIENRSWRTSHRGLVAIHAGKKEDVDCCAALCHHAGPYHPVTGHDFPIDIGQRVVGNDGLFDTFSPPAWHNHKGGIVGVAEIIDCVDRSNSDWFVGEFGFVIGFPQPIECIPCKGALGFFDWRRQMEVQS